MVIDALTQRAYFALNLLGGAAMLLLLATLAIPGRNPLFSRSRVATLTSLCFSRLISVVFSCLLLFSGTVAGPPPSNSLCIAQATLIVSTKSPLLSFTTFTFVLYLWILISSRDPERPLTTSSNLALIIFPYLFWTFLVIGSLALAVKGTISVERSTFYCTINDADRILTKTTSTLSAVIYLLALVSLVSVLALFHRRKPSLHLHDPPVPFKGHINIRLGILALYCLLFAGLAILDAVDYTKPVMDILRALDGLLIYGIFGSQRWVIGTWTGWFGIQSSESSIHHPRSHRGSHHQKGPNPSPIIFSDSMASRHSTPRQIVSQVFRSTGQSGKAARLLGFNGLPSEVVPAGVTPETVEDAQIRQWEEETAKRRFRALNIALGLEPPSPKSTAELALGKHTPWTQIRTASITPMPPARHESPFLHQGNVMRQEDGNSSHFSSTGMSYIGIALGGSDVTPSPYPHSPHSRGDLPTMADQGSPRYELEPLSHTSQTASDFVDMDPPMTSPDETHTQAAPSLVSPEVADSVQPVCQSVLYVHSRHHSPRNSAFASSVSHELSENWEDNEPDQGGQSRRSSFLPISMRSGSSSKSGSKGSKGSKGAKPRQSFHSIESGKHDDLPTIEVNSPEDAPPLPSASDNNRLDTVVERSPQTSVEDSNPIIVEVIADTPTRPQHHRQETSFYSFSSVESLPQPVLPSNQITPAGSVIMIPEVDPEPISSSDPYVQLHSVPLYYREHPFSPIATIQRELSGPTHLDFDTGDHLSRRISPRAQHYANQVRLNPLNEPPEAGPSRGQFLSMGVLQEEARTQESAGEGEELSRRPSFRIRRKPVPSLDRKE